ncbi:MAG: hypothetical protein ABW065_12650 [Solirubrobacterales bacterium]
MRRRAEARVASTLAAEPAAVAAWALSAEGINFELAPWLRMTVPRGASGLDVHSLRPGPVGRSWLLAFGLIPVDYDEIGLVRVDPEGGFLERSTMLSQRRWEHERTIAASEVGTVVVDRIAWEPRAPLPGSLLRPLFAAFFRHRHRRLRHRFGGEPLPPSSP